MSAIYTIGFAGKNAETFFSILRDSKIRLLVDIRLNNVSQLAGFTKAADLPFFLRDICIIHFWRHRQTCSRTTVMATWTGKPTNPAILPS